MDTHGQQHAMTNHDLFQSSIEAKKAVNYRCDNERGYRISFKIRDPLVLLYHGFLTDQESDHLIALA